MTHVMKACSELVMTKSRTNSTARYEEWKRTFTTAQTLIRTLDQTTLRDSLGGNYEHLVELRDARQEYKHQSSAYVGVATFCTQYRL